MQLSKILISLLLLLTYSFGFAHNLVPHCGEIIPHEAHAPSHEHHQHSEGEKQLTKHSHVTHNNHFDEGVYDYLVCLVNETDDSDTECSIEHCFTFSSNNFSLKKINKIQTAIVLFAVFQPTVQNESIAYSSTDLEINYLSPPLEDSPHRGPPIV
ncbi:MAG: hypothetical protein COA97_10715 [Flavobacteriales bacterium]|nr:MAG: hypothetical protein COA97_10715 [Flavobacteriales bacterium]